MTTYTQKAVTKAIEGDYDAHWDDTVEMFFSSERKNKNGNLVTLTEERIVLDPAFWRCLYPSETDAIMKAQGLITHLFNGGTIEQYFEQISSLGEKQQAEEAPSVSDLQNESEEANK